MTLMCVSGRYNPRTKINTMFDGITYINLNKFVYFELDVVKCPTSNKWNACIKTAEEGENGCVDCWIIKCYNSKEEAEDRIDRVNKILFNHSIII